MKESSGFQFSPIVDAFPEDHPANRELEWGDVEIIPAPVAPDSDMVIAGAKAFLKICGKTLDDVEELEQQIGVGLVDVILSVYEAMMAEARRENERRSADNAQANDARE